MKKKEIIIIGAGLVGSLLSIYLSRRGHTVRLFERRPDMRRTSVVAGRSINLALSDRGLLALDKVGLTDEIRKIAIPMNGRFIHNADGTTAVQPYGKEGQFINSVSRSELNKKLMDLAEESGVEITFEKKCERIDWTKNEILFADGKTANADIIFGADGAFAASRLQHQLQHEKFNYEQFYIDCGYKELSVPAGPGGSFLLEKNALHIWPRKDFMLIALPNLDGSFTCTLFFPFEGERSFDKLDTADKVLEFFKETFPDVVKLIPDLMEQYLRNPVSSLVTVKCFPWIRGGKFALIGDAAHAIVPFFGQGMNCGFEDCRILDELIEEGGDNWEDILSEFQRQRKPDADAIAELAIDNFTEMRDRTADPKFLLQKRIEAALHAKYPSKWIPAYTQVTFSPHIRYSEARKRGLLQEEIMREVMKQDVKNYEDPMFLESIIRKIEPLQKNS